MGDAPWQTIQRINRAWRAGDAVTLGELFHAHAVIVHPGFAGRSEGREACVRSYEQFAASAAVHHFEERDPQVDVVGDTAVVTYGFEITYEMDGEPRHDSGRDLLVLTRQGAGPWRVVWRTLVTEA